MLSDPVLITLWVAVFISISGILYLDYQFYRLIKGDNRPGGPLDTFMGGNADKRPPRVIARTDEELADLEERKQT